jgi:hypothetical protein
VVNVTAPPPIVIHEYTPAPSATPTPVYIPVTYGAPAPAPVPAPSLPPSQPTPVFTGNQNDLNKLILKHVMKKLAKHI